MLNKKLQLLTRIVGISLFLLFFNISFACAVEKGSITFNLSRAVTDRNWEEILVGKGTVSLWCGNNTLIFNGGASFSSFDLKTKKVKDHLLEKENSYRPVDCTSDGRYLFLKKQFRKGGKTASTLEIYETQGMRRIQSLPIPNGLKVEPQLSPDDSMLIWHSSEKREAISLDQNRLLTLLPVFKSKTKLVETVWLFDSKKIYLVNYKDPSDIIEYDATSKTQKILLLEKSEVLVQVAFIVLPDGSRKQIHTHFLNGLNKYRHVIFNVELRGENPSTPSKEPLLVIGQELTQKNDIFLQINAWRKWGDTLAGLYLIEKDGKKLKKILKGNHSYLMKFSPDGKSIAYSHPVNATGDAVHHNLFILSKKQSRLE